MARRTRARRSERTAAESAARDAAAREAAAQQDAVQEPTASQQGNKHIALTNNFTFSIYKHVFAFFKGPARRTRAQRARDDAANAQPVPGPSGQQGGGGRPNLGARPRPPPIQIRRVSESSSQGSVGSLPSPFLRAGEGPFTPVLGNY